MQKHKTNGSTFNKRCQRVLHQKLQNIFEENIRRAKKMESEIKFIDWKTELIIGVSFLWQIFKFDTIPIISPQTFLFFLKIDKLIQKIVSKCKGSKYPKQS